MVHVINLSSLFLAHWVGDFLFQPSEMALKKSKSLKWLGLHILRITAVVMFVSFYINLSWKFILYNAIAHAVIDWNIWRFYKRHVGNKRNLPKHAFSESGEFKYWEDSAFYRTLGFDQFLHYTTFIILYGLEKF